MLLLLKWEGFRLCVVVIQWHLSRRVFVRMSRQSRFEWTHESMWTQLEREKQTSLCEWADIRCKKRESDLKNLSTERRHSKCMCSTNCKKYIPALKRVHNLGVKNLHFSVFLCLCIVTVWSREKSCTVNSFWWTSTTVSGDFCFSRKSTPQLH